MSQLAEELAELGVTVEQARAFLMANLGNLQLILHLAQEYELTNDMLGELAGGYSGEQVEAYFDANGLDSDVLDAINEFYDAEDMPAMLLQLVHLNDGAGMLATASLGAGVAASVGQASYDAAFDPGLYEGSLDGTFSTAELGFSSLGDLAATQATLESLFYGTLLTALGRVDVGEQGAMNDIFSFVDANEQQLMEDDDTAVFEQLVGMIEGVFSDAATTPLLGESQMYEIAVDAGEMFVQLMIAEGDMSIFDGLLLAFF